MECVVTVKGRKYFIWKDKENGLWYMVNGGGISFEYFEDLLNYYKIPLK